MQGMLLHYIGMYNEEICYCLSENSTIIHIIAVSTKKRLGDHGIVVQLPLCARDSFSPKICTSFLQQFILKSQTPQFTLYM